MAKNRGKQYQLVWANPAKLIMLEQLVYVKKEWGLVAEKRFKSKLLRALDQICTNPLTCPQCEGFADIRKKALNKYLTLYFTIKQDTIYIVSCFPNHQNPYKLKQELKA